MERLKIVYRKMCTLQVVNSRNLAVSQIIKDYVPSSSGSGQNAKIIGKYQFSINIYMVCTISGKGILLPPIFSNLHNFGTERDTTNEHKMNSIDTCSIYQPQCFLSYLFQFSS